MKIILVIYSLFILLFSAFTYLFIDPNFTPLSSLFSGYAYEQRMITSIAYCLFIVLFFVFYIYFLKASQNKNFTVKKLVYILIPVLFFTVSYPAILSYDIFNYMATAKVTFFYYENPYLVMPIEFIGDSMLMYTRAANKFALYGPGWIALTSIPFYLSFSSVLAQILLFKVFVSIFYLGTVFLIYKISRSIFITSFFALNPLVIIETFVSGHNDIVMMCLALLGIYFLKEKKIFLSFVFLIFSIFIKFATIFLIPVWVYVLYKRLKKEEIKWDMVWLIGFISMAIVFLLSPLREEMYPWYFIWLLPFMALANNKTIFVTGVSITAGLLFYYIPYMYTGYYLLSYKFLSVLCVFVVTFLCLRYMSRIKKVWGY